MGQRVKRFLITAIAFIFCYIFMNAKLKFTTIKFIRNTDATQASPALQTAAEAVEEGKERTSDRSAVRRRTVFPRETTNVVLLSSGPRSGSTFLGELISLPRSTFYFFEPRHMMREKSYIKKTLSSELHRLFTCDFSRLNFSSPHRVYRTLHHSATSKCLTRGCPAPTGEQMQKLCISATNRVLKTVRMPLDWIRNIVEDPNENVKLIHLVRDPRGSFPSARKLGYSTAPEMERCRLIEQDLNTSEILERRHPDKLIRITYEQLCLQPWDVARELYHFIKYVNKAVCTQPSAKEEEESLALDILEVDNGRKISLGFSSPTHDREITQRRTLDPPQLVKSSSALRRNSSQNDGSVRQLNVGTNQTQKSLEKFTFDPNEASLKLLEIKPIDVTPRDEKILKQSYFDEDISHQTLTQRGQYIKYKEFPKRKPNNKNHCSSQSEMNDRLELPSFVRDHLLVHLHPNILTSNRGDPHSTIKDHKSVYRVWRRVLTLDDVRATQDACRGVITKLNHAFFDSLVDLRNVSIDYVLSRWRPRTLDPC